MSKKKCSICGRGSGERTYDEKRNNLTERDAKLVYCQNCGAVVCGFCSHLGWCCDQGESEEI